MSLPDLRLQHKKEQNLFIQNFVNLINEDAEKYKQRQSRHKELLLPNLNENWINSANRRSQLSKQLKEYTKQKDRELKTQLTLNTTAVVNNLTSNNPSLDLIDALVTSSPDNLQLYFGSNAQNITNTLYSNELLNAMVRSANERHNGASIGDILTGALAVPTVGGATAGLTALGRSATSRGLTKPIGNMLAGMLAGETINYGAERMGYGSFGGFAGQMTGTNPKYNWAWEFTNPGYIVAPFSEGNRLLTVSRAYDLTKPKVPLTTLANEYSKGMFNIDWNATPYYIPSKVKNSISTVSDIIANNGYATVNNIDNGKISILNWVSLTNPKSWRGRRSYMNLMNGDNGAFILYVNSMRPGEGRKLYDAAIINARKLGLPGLITGTDLYSAPKTLSMLKHHYPEKEILNNNGSWDNANMLIPGTLFNKPTVRLTNPTPQEYLQVAKNNPGLRVLGTEAPVYLLRNPSRNRTVFGLNPEQKNTVKIMLMN